jgi:3-oxoadipate enol-lactonase
MPHVSVNGIRMAFDVVGEGPPLLLLHGGLVSRTEWRPQIAYFAQQGYQVITCDLRGHGESASSRQPYSVTLFRADVLGLLDALGLARVACCGHSLGGMVGQELAIAHPERVRALVLADTAYGTATTRGEAVLTLMAKGLFRLLSVQQVARRSARALGRFHPEVGPYIERELGRHAQDKANYLNIWRAVCAFDSRPRLHRIACPTLILVGQFNRRTHAQAREMCRRILQAELVIIPGAGHMLNWDNAEAFNQVVARFLHRVMEPAASPSTQP